MGDDWSQDGDDPPINAHPAYGCFAGMALLASALVSGAVIGWAVAGVWEVTTIFWGK